VPFEQRSQRPRAAAPVAPRELVPEILHPHQPANLRGGHGLLEGFGVLDARKVEQGARRAGEWEPVGERDVVGVKGSSANHSHATQAFASGRGRRNPDRRIGWVGEEAVDPGGAAVADECSGAAREPRDNLAAPVAWCVVGHAIDAAVRRKQKAVGEPPVDPLPVDAGGQELPARNVARLTSREPLEGIDA
jgi:hypothetical protein